MPVDSAPPSGRPASPSRGCPAGWRHSSVIHLHTSVLISETTLPPILAEFARAHPGVQVQLTLSNRFVDLAEERLDLVIRELALRGAGMAQLPAYLCQDAIDDGTLVPVLQAVRSRPATLYAMYPSRRGMTSAVRVFLELVRARWPSNPATA
ncbi:LysR family transcriptional regulator [Pandoraea eparura]|uniref:LysR family transcriptional regulator n=1 Tax=Pandoraea eparura TaxID=2508291 RepID=A0A5E4SY56_9BURK|nr:LysR family transcriptional regulator [Pandoraea eparura]